LIRSSTVLLRIGVYTIAIVFGILIAVLMALHGFSELEQQLAAGVWVLLCWLYTVFYLPLK
jgi:hypothetical protein